jgi:hypothetical protein
MMTISVDKERPKLGAIDTSVLEKMNETYHFKNDSKMSIQAGMLKETN